MKLAKTELGEGWLDLSYGEPLIVREILKSFLDESIVQYDLLGYPLATGYKPLTSFLEDKYNAKVVISNGAKQGLSAAFYALKKMNHKSIMLHKPFWSSTPFLIEKEGLKVRYLNEDEGCSAFCLTSPNNPDGYELTAEQMIEAHKDAKSNNVRLIHDAAYYTPIYLREPKDILTNFGDVQIYSCSKMWGLSGLRVGYIVCHNEDFYDLTSEYVESTTAGVSIASQEIVLDVEQQFKDNPEALKSFYLTCRASLKNNKEIVRLIDKDVLEPINLDSSSMFVWCKKGPKFDMQKAKVNLVDGVLFGAPGMVRMNVALRSSVVQEAVDRLNTL